MKVLKNIALGVLLVGASMGVTSAANAYGCGYVHYGYGWSSCNTYARPCNTGCRLFSCVRRPACNPCRAYVRPVCNPCAVRVRTCSPCGY